jgi:hypothetical protein
MVTFLGEVKKIVKHVFRRPEEEKKPDPKPLKCGPECPRFGYFGCNDCIDEAES